MLTVEEFRDQARGWVGANRHDAPPDWGAIMPPESRDAGMAWQKRIHDAGFAGIHWPTEYGGRGLSVDHHRAWAEECQTVGVPSILNMVGLVLAAGGLLQFGTDAQKSAHLPGTVRGDRVWCQLFSEPDAGSDLAGLSTRAELDGDRWIVNGQKVWTSAARASDWGILMARTEPDASKHEGISFFVIDMGTPGVETRPLRQMTGEAEFDEVFLVDVELPSDALIGDRGQGWGIAMAALTSERGHIGGTTRTVERAIGDLVGRHQHVDPVSRARLADVVLRGRAHLAMITAGGAHPSLGKLAMADYRFEMAELDADLSGADAMLASRSADHLLRAPGGWFGGGTTQVQRNIIGERVLGLPREPRP